MSSDKVREALSGTHHTTVRLPCNVRSSPELTAARSFHAQAIFAQLICFGLVLSAQQPAWQPSPGHIRLQLWPNGAPGAQPNLGPEINTTTAKEPLIAGKPIIRLGNVASPTITLYSAKKNAHRTTVVVFPGGAYRILAIDLEGTEVCSWLNSIDVNCVLLKYSVPNSGPYPKSSAALQDAQRAVALVRLHAAEWHLDPERIGVLGFSAGAHLAAALGTHSDHRLYNPVDSADQLSCRPDFAVIVYPGYLALSEQNFASNPEIRVTLRRLPRLSCRRKTIPSTLRTQPSITLN
jgi:acetyl esterase/lipase